jgi:hypothetical protein
MSTHWKKARIGFAIGLAMLWMHPLLTGDQHGLEAQVQQTTTQELLAAPEAPDGPEGMSVPAEAALTPAALAALTAEGGATPATPEDFERECSAPATACTAIVHAEQTVAHATAPLVGHVINAYRWEWTDAVRYGWCSTRSCHYVGTLRLGAYLDLAGIESLWYQAADALTLPAVRATLRWNCVDDNGWRPNTSCSGGWQTKTNPHYTTGIFDAGDYNTHRDPGTYWYDFRYAWQAAGYPGITWNYGPLTSAHFTCAGGGVDCYFPRTR